MDIRYELQTGWPSSTNLHRRISQYVRDATNFKIGITDNPSSRAYNYTDRWDEMLVLYQTSSIDNVREMEDMMIVYYPESDNENRGGGGRIGSPPYYLYVVIEW